MRRVSYADIISQGKSMMQLINLCNINLYVRYVVNAIYYLVHTH